MKKISLLLFSNLVLLFAAAQFSTVGQPSVSLVNLIPKSPQAEQLMRVSEVAINASTGVPQLSFTLYTAVAGDIKIPISISYDASGIRYDDVPSSVGLKWSLQAGGEISRSINGRPDEQFYFANAHKYSQDIFSSWNMYTDSAHSFFKDVTQNLKDISQDQYSYTYSGRSGQFFFRNNKLWDSESPYTTKIEADNFTGFNNLIITEENGNKAYFGDQKEEGSFVEYTGLGYTTPDVPTEGATAWKLNKLKSYTSQEALFEYDTVNYAVSKVLSHAYVYRQPVEPDPLRYSCNCGSSDISESSVNINYLVYIPKKITTPLEEVDFYYSRNNGLSIYKKRLDSIIVKDRINQVRVKKFVFKYGAYSSVNLLRLDQVWSMGTNNDSLLVAGFHYNSGSIAGMSSLGRDIFNYNNGASNTYLISTSNVNYPYTSASRGITSSVNNGNIDSVFYNTGGRAAFFFSPNQIGDTCGPGVKVDSIKYYNNDYKLASSLEYNYADMKGGYIFSGVVNANSYDAYNSLCPVWTFGSEVPFPMNVGSAVNYGMVTTKRKGNSGTTPQLSKDFFSIYTNCYFKSYPVLDKKILFKNNSNADTVKIETYAYNQLAVDSVSLDWLYPGYSFLPSQTYYMDGDLYNNTNYCEVIYSGAGRYGILTPTYYRNVVASVKEISQTSSSVSLTNTSTRMYNSYWQPTVDKKYTSAGSLDSTVYNYLYNNGGTTSTNAIAANLYGIIDRTTRYDNTAQVEKSRTRFFTQGNGFVQPDSFLTQTMSHGELLDQLATAYDAEGNLEEIDAKKGFYTALLRDYNNTLVTASVTNTRLAQIAQTSFETNHKGGWTFSGSIADDVSSPTGGKCYYASGGITKSGLTSATYIISYWGKAGSVTVNSGSPARTGKAINGWTFYEHEITGTSVTVSGNKYIDELRLYPKGARMKSFTYYPLIGIRSECDENNQLTYYEYDSFNRLKLIRDEDGRILRRMDYQYQSTNL